MTCTDDIVGRRSDIEDDVLPTARRLGIGLVPYSPLGRGFLAGAVSTDTLGVGDFRLGDPRFQDESLERNRALAPRCRLAAEREVTPAQLALAWLLAQGEDVVPIPGPGASHVWPRTPGVPRSCCLPPISTGWRRPCPGRPGRETASRSPPTAPSGLRYDRVVTPSAPNASTSRWATGRRWGRTSPGQRPRPVPGRTGRHGAFRRRCRCPRRLRPAGRTRGRGARAGLPSPDRPRKRTVPRSRRPGTGLRTAGADDATTVLSDVRAAMDHLRAVGSERVSMVGLSLGGHIAYLAATEFDLAAVAVFYGGWLPTTDISISRPEPTVSLTPKITGRVLFLVGENDHVVPSGQQREIADALREADVHHEIVVYPGIGHGFLGTDRAASADAWRRVRALLTSVEG